MVELPHSGSKNELLSRLSPRQYQWFWDNSTQVELKFGEVLTPADSPIKHVYFPRKAFISMLVAVPDAPAIEMGLIGNEGMLGASLALGNKRAPMQAVVQGAGSALRMDTDVFCLRVQTNAALRNLIHAYLYVLFIQLAQAGACNCFHDVHQRLARWLLMTHDRAHSDHFHLTHQFLATMLGVRRSAVTIAAGHLQHQGMITYSRGQIQVVSRSKLLDSSCACYGQAIDSYQQNLTQHIRLC